MAEPDSKRAQARGVSRQWIKLAITLLLLIAVVATGTLVFHSRSAFWEKYLSVVR
jgi:membrane protein YdbS with pleckstrin-like domain